MNNFKFSNSGDMVLWRTENLDHHMNQDITYLLDTNDYIAGHIDLNTAENKISDIDNINMVGIDEHNVGDHLYYAMEESKAEVALSLQGDK